MYQHPLAYLIGLEGIALLRAFSGAYDREFTLARLHEIRELLESPNALGTGIEARPISTREGYDSWAPSYDEPGNQLLEIEQPIVREILDGMPIGVALDAACGTGRHAAYLASLGHTVIGVDSSPGMLARAREKIPQGEFHQADLHELPLADDSVDLVVCAIALVHLPNIESPFREFARVLRPGGHLVVSDHRGLIGDIGLPVGFDDPQGDLGYMPVYARLASEYLAAALPLGFRVLRCEEPRVPSPLLDDEGRTVHDGERLPPQDPNEPPYTWSLHAEAIDATNAAWRGKPSSIIWLFRLERR
ncbi:MAG: class I SAM-dependent methyltransferase [Thermoleophilia bacterium]|nr:class I SAM-dependent methyltransferase [Thermoleophilia bacterium]